MKKIYLKFLPALFLLATSATAWSQGNTCGAATTITLGGCATSDNIGDGTITGSLAPSCSASTIRREGWYQFVVPIGTTSVTITAESGNRDLLVQVFSGAGCAGFTQIGCAQAITGNSAQFETVSLTGLTPGTYYIRILNVGSTGDMTLNALCVAATATNNEPNTATVLTVGSDCSSPVSGTTAGATSSTCGTIPAPGCASYVGGDIWYSVTVPPSGQLIFDTYANGMTDGGLAIYTGTACGAMTLVDCDDNSGAGSMPQLSLTGLTAGSTLFARVWASNWMENAGTFDICVTDPCFCSGTPIVGTISATSSTVYACANTTTLTLGSPSGCAYTYQWQSSPDNTTWTNIAGATSMTYNATLTASTYYRVRVTCGYSGLTGSSLSTAIAYNDVPANDLPCGAQPLTLGVPSTGYNTCATGTSEPGSASCWTAGNLNTVWYTFVPTSTSVRIKTIPVSSTTPLLNTQIAVYSAPTGCSGTLTQIGCNEDAADCGTYAQVNSDLALTGLTIGTTYYIRVDGSANIVGEFQIMVINGSTSSFPLVPGQDCSQAYTLCNATTTIGNPGYQVIGGQCDHNGNNNCTSGEANSVWYQINIGTAGQLTFDIVPNDFGNPNPITGQSNPGYTGVGAETDYDFVLWKIGGTGATNCATITSSGGNNEVACNFDVLGVCGCSASGNAPAAYAGFNNGYETGPMAAVGDVFLLVIQNYSSSTSGFSLQFPTGTPATFPATTSLSWTAGASTTAWTTAANWGGCGTPSCTVDAVVTAASAIQPVLGVGTFTVRDLTINPGAVLTLQSGCLLRVCGNFTNNGSLVCNAGSTVEFIGTGTQNLTGSFIGSDAFNNFTVTKTLGSVVLNNDIRIKNNFLTTNATSILNTNGMAVTVGGNFTNAAGNTTYTGTTGTLTFNGTGTQTYNQGSSALDLQNIVMNHTGTGVTLATDMNAKTATGTITFTAGKIITGASFQVYCKNTAAGAVSAGNATSYVEGFLRRNISGTGSYEFPVGTSAKGYQRATIDFTTATTTISNLRANFNNWAAVPGAIGVTDCTVPYNLPFLDNGYWTINAFNGGGTQISGDGTYTCTLWPTNHTNSAGANEWTIAKDPNNTLTWSLTGTCNMASTVGQVIRTAMSGFSGFSVVQSATSLPVELLSFTGEEQGKNHLLKWVTASEHNNEWFILEQCTDGVSFMEIYRTPGQAFSSSSLNYQHLNQYPDPGVNYYRLKQVDTDGNFSYSNVVVLKNEADQVVLDNLYPNPTNGDMQFDLTSYGEGVFSVEVYDIAGRLVISKTHAQEKGRHVVTIETSHLSQGTYTLRVEQNGGRFKSVNRIVRY